MYSSHVKKVMDYQVDFIDCQRLEKLLENLSLSQEILKSIEWTIHTVQSSHDYTKLLDGGESKQNPRDLHRMTRYINRVQRYMGTASALQYRAERTTVLVSLLGLVYETSL